MTKSILVVQELYPEQIDELKEKASDYKIVESIEEADASTVEIIIGWSDDLIPLIEDEASNVKWVQFAYAGVNALPLKLFTEKGILLTNGSGIHAKNVTETIIGVILGMTRAIVRSAKNQEKKEWSHVHHIYELEDKTMLVVGAGKFDDQHGKVDEALNR